MRECKRWVWLGLDVGVMCLFVVVEVYSFSVDGGVFEC